MKISTQFIYPPIPCRDFDWCAIDADSYDGTEDDPHRGQIGYGATEAEAVHALAEILEDAGRAPDEVKLAVTGHLRTIAYHTVVRVRGSNDVPAFDLCVDAELARLMMADPNQHIHQP